MANEERIREALAIINREDEFDKLRAAAEAAVPQPKCPKYLANAPELAPHERQAQLDIVAEQIKKTSRRKKASQSPARSEVFDEKK
jgi:hypothetical protein